jgi:hypothetical protein
LRSSRRPGLGREPVSVGCRIMGSSTIQ